MIKMENVCFSFLNHMVLEDFSLCVPTGATVCLVGPSGCGKTTVLRLVAGLLHPRKGYVFAEGKMSMVFQNDRLVPYLTVCENLSLVGRATDILNRFGLKDVGQQYPADLSGGMARRVAIARAVAYGGEILLLDEPFNGLDTTNRQNAAAIIQSEFRGKTILLVSHNEDDIALMHAEVFPMPNKYTT